MQECHREKEEVETFHAQVPASSVVKISQWHRKAGARKAQCQAERSGEMR